jgi:peptidoglycan/LPS O-acetylase OafA/YrhL
LPNIYHDIAQKIYYPTYIRGSSFLIGIILAFYLHESKQIEKGPLLKFFLWIFVLVQLTLPIYASQFLNLIGRNVFLNAFLIGFARIMWALAIACLIILCNDGNGRFVNQFLSNKFWNLIGKIGLSFYLVHPVLQYNYISSRKHLINLETGPMVKYSLKILNTQKL